VSTKTGVARFLADSKMFLYFLRRHAILAVARLRGSGDAKSIFSDIYSKNLFGDPRSRSGRGSSMEATKTVREFLPQLIHRHHITSVLDVPCGDFHWMQTVDLSGVRYVGADIVETAIGDLDKTFGREGRSFVHLDARTDQLPQVDLILCRDLFMHLPSADVIKVLKNFKASGAKYLFSTTFVAVKVNGDTHTGGFRPFNLKAEPFSLGEPLETMDDFDVSRQWGRSMALWKLN
jgi:SAM-dependent methyltransferase